MDVATLRWMGASLLCLAGLWLSILNWIALVRRLSSKKPSPSWIPLLGGLLGFGAVLLAPNAALIRFWWLPFLIDGGSAPGFAVTLAWTISRRLRR